MPLSLSEAEQPNDNLLSGKIPPEVPSSATHLKYLIFLSMCEKVALTSVPLKRANRPVHPEIVVPLDSLAEASAAKKVSKVKIRFRIAVTFPNNFF